MRRRAATSRVTLQAHALPPSAQFTELNYRTRVTTFRQDVVTTVRLIFVWTTAFSAIGFGLRLLEFLPLWASGPFIGILLLGSLALAYWRFLRGMPSSFELFLALIVLVVIVLFTLVNYAPTGRDAYLWIFGTAIAVSAVFSYLVTVQACAFMAVNERIPRLRMLRWLRHLGRLNTMHTPGDCPEMTGFRLGFFLLAFAYAIGFVTLEKARESGHGSDSAMLGVLAFLGSLVALRLILAWLRGVPLASLWTAFIVTSKALVTFVCYNRHRIEAAGLFRFPTRALRPPHVRDLFLGLTLAFLTTAAVGVTVSSPTVFAEQYRPVETAKGDSTKKAPPKPAPPPFKLSPVEERFQRTLPVEQQAPYFEAKKKEHEARLKANEETAQGRARLSLLTAIGLVLFVCSVGPITVLIAVFWFLSGPLLNRFHEALEAPNAYEVPPEPTKAEFKLGKRPVTTWDNRVERVRFSANREEQEHFYLGASMEGDFPVLLHQSLLHRHAHILGDTGSRKTSIGLAPLITQLISREDSSVVIFDLKGDLSFFNAVKDEADAAGLPFRHFTNIVGKSSYAFNPLRQEHLSRLTTDQLTQGILQALELEHGEGYGRGHFTALNDAVLGGVLKKYRKVIGSFADLHGYVRNRHVYRNLSGGDDEDYRHTRQLVNLVEKLSHLAPLNVGPTTFPEKPRVFDKRIDMASVLRRPQVLYFYLSSSLDPRTVSPLAKLAMFSLLTASEFREKPEPKCYVFIDEFQRVISEAMTIFFEQARSKGLHFILANQAFSQLNSRGVDITGVIESCTGFKQSFRASDQESIKRIIEGSGEALYHSVGWTRAVRDAHDEASSKLISLEHALRWHRDETSVNVSEQIAPRLERNAVIETSALPFTSFVKFDEGSGYTQFASYWTPIVSEFHITKPLYDYFGERPLPLPGEETIEVTAEAQIDPDDEDEADDERIPNPPKVPSRFEDDMDSRLDY